MDLRYIVPVFTLVGMELWSKGEIMKLIDGDISNACVQEEILRCIHVGLLGVQELAKDRHPFRLFFQCFVVKLEIFL